MLSALVAVWHFSRFELYPLGRPRNFLVAAAAKSGGLELGLASVAQIAFVRGWCAVQEV